nr:uncharacterized protein LOC113393770 [Vanessa tameamea]
MRRSRAGELLEKNRNNQDSYVNKDRRPPKTFNVGDCAFLIKYSQSTGKLDAGMRGPYRVIKVLPGGRYELKLLSGARGKTTQAAAQYMVPWKGEWCPESCASFFEDAYDNDEIVDVAIAGPSANLISDQETVWVPEDGAPSGKAVLE